MDIDENLSFNDILDVLQEGLLPSGSAIMDGEFQVWPGDEEKQNDEKWEDIESD